MPHALLRAQHHRGGEVFRATPSMAATHKGKVPGTLGITVQHIFSAKPGLRYVPCYYTCMGNDPVFSLASISFPQFPSSYTVTF